MATISPPKCRITLLFGVYNLIYSKGHAFDLSVLVTLCLLDKSFRRIIDFGSALDEFTLKHLYGSTGPSRYLLYCGNYLSINQNCNEFMMDILIFVFL